LLVEEHLPFWEKAFKEPVKYDWDKPKHPVLQLE